MEPLLSNNRLSRHKELAARISEISDSELSKLTRSISRPQAGWGSSGEITLEGTKLFIKRIPITKLELENPYSTKNLYCLPNYYSYGLGSAGFGVWREIAAAKKSSSWVLQGACPNFPLLHHHRVVLVQGHGQALDVAAHAKYIEFWNNSTQIGQFIEDRTHATHEAIMVFEHIPHVLADYLNIYPERTAEFVNQMMLVIDFMQSNGMIHFDCHPDNIVTDGVHYYLTDFGLAMDQSFELSAAEMMHWNNNTYYDQATVVARLARYITADYYKSSDSTRAKVLKMLDIAVEPQNNLQLQMLLLNDLEQLVQAGLLCLNDVYVREMVKYTGVTNLLIEFARSMMATSQKTIQIDNKQLGSLFEFINNTNAGELRI